jgi:glutamine amidotransferase
VERIHACEGKVRIALVGKYVQLHDAYLSVAEALKHAAIHHGVELEIDWVDAEAPDLDELLAKADGVLVPGGFGGRGIEGKIAATRFARERGVPFLGICLGMQLMAARGSEGGDTEGLGLIRATVPRLVPDAPTTRIPHIGWNNVAGAGRLFDGIAPDKDFYFVHSYHVVPDDPADVLATTPYCGGFVSAVAHDAMFGVQFHPEKSQKVGFHLLRNFLAC